VHNFSGMLHDMAKDYIFLIRDKAMNILNITPIPPEWSY